VAIGVKVELKGLKEAIDALKVLQSPGTQRRILRDGVSKAMRPLAKDIKARLKPHKRTGLLEKSIGFRVKITKRKTVAGIVGPRTGFRQAIKAGRGDTVIYANPTQYYHLLEFGTSHSAAKPTLRPAWAAGKRGAENRFRDAVKAGLEREMAWRAKWGK
jgi:HK97 gp10 family phage protein